MVDFAFEIKGEKTYIFSTQRTRDYMSKRLMSKKPVLYELEFDSVLDFFAWGDKKQKNKKHTILPGNDLIRVIKKAREQDNRLAARNPA